MFLEGNCTFLRIRESDSYFEDTWFNNRIPIGKGWCEYSLFRSPTRPWWVICHTLGGTTLCLHLVYLIYLPEIFCALDTSLTAYLEAKLQQSLHQSLFGTSIWFLLNAWHKNSYFISKPQDNHSPTQKKRACICNFICGIHVSSSAFDSMNHNQTSTFYYIQKVFGIPYLYPIIQQCCLISVNHISASSKSKQ